MTIATRPELPEDEPFVRRLIVETVSAELGAAAWPEPMRSHLLGIQYTSRRAGTASRFPHARNLIVLADGGLAGWLVTAVEEDHIHIVEILIAESYRGRGIGSSLLRQIIAEAEAARQPVRLGVRAGNLGAIRLYERLGFRRIGGDEVQLEMEFPRAASP